MDVEEGGLSGASFTLFPTSPLAGSENCRTWHKYCPKKEKSNFKCFYILQLNYLTTFTNPSESSLVVTKKNSFSNWQTLTKWLFYTEI